MTITKRLLQLVACEMIAANLPLAGCASGTDLIAAGHVTLEPRIDRALREPPDVLDRNGELVISGRLERGLPRALGGHIDVTVTGPDGSLVYDAQVDYQTDAAPSSRSGGPRSGSFRRAHSRYGSRGVYSISFPGLPPGGSVIRVKYDRKPHGPPPQQ